MKEIKKISLNELRKLAEKMYGNMVKADVDVARSTIVIDMSMHADGEAYLLEQGSKQADLWGVNLHPSKFGTDEFVEFDSMINLRPSQNNFSRGIADPKIRAKIIAMVKEAVHE